MSLNTSLTDPSSLTTAVAPRKHVAIRSVEGLLLLTGAAILLWGLLGLTFRNSEGSFKGNVILPLAVGVALLIVGGCITSKYLRFGSWLGMALIGQAVALQLIDAGPLIHYQHYRPFLVLAHESRILLTWLLVQTIFVTIFLFKSRYQIKGWVSANFKTWKLVPVGLIFTFSAAALSRQTSAYASELLFATYIQTLNLLTILAAAMAFPRDGLRWVTTFDRLTSTSRAVIGSAIWVTLLASLLSYYSYQRHPHIPDEVVYLYQARYLAAGSLSVPAPPSPAAFDVYLMEVKQDRWFAVPPPGWPMILAVGVFFGFPWLVNPLLGGVNVLLAFAVVRELFDRRLARWVVMLLCVSPWHIFMAMNFMTHTATLTFALLATLGVIKARKTNLLRWTTIAGISIGVVSLIRPLEGLVVATLLGLWAVGVGGKRLKLASIATLVACTALTGALVLPYNKQLTGVATANPIMVYTDQHFGVGSNAIGFGPQRGFGWGLDPYPGHGPLDATVNANLNVFSLNIELLGWSCGSLLLIALFLFSGQLGRSDYFMLATMAAVFIAHFFYWYSGGPDFGARYWYLMLIPCLALTAKGIRYLQTMLFQNGEGSRVIIAVIALSALSVVVYIPWRAVDKYHHYLRMRPDLNQLATDLKFGKSVVLVRGQDFPDYASAFTYNPIDLNAATPVYVWDRSSALTEQVLRSFPDRPVWVVDGPSITQRGYEVVEGPRPARGFLLTEVHK